MKNFKGNLLIGVIILIGTILADKYLVPHLPDGSVLLKYMPIALFVIMLMVVALLYYFSFKQPLSKKLVFDVMMVTLIFVLYIINILFESIEKIYLILDTLH